MMKRTGTYLTIIASIVTMAALSSCAGKLEDPVREKIIDTVNISLTKAPGSLDEYDLAPDGSTYSVMLYNTLNGNSLFTYYGTGFYQYRDDHDDSTVDYLHAAKLDASGNYQYDDPEAGLNRVSGSWPFDIAFISPGIKPNSDGSVTFYPNAGDEEGRLMGAGVIRRELGNYTIIKTDSLLFDRRCKIKYRVFLGRELRDNSLKVNSVTLEGAGACEPDTPVKYFPQTRQSVADTSIYKSVYSEEFSDGGVIHRDGGKTLENPLNPELIGLPYCELMNAFYIGSGIYAPLSQTAKALNTIVSEDMYLQGLNFLRLTLNIDQGSRTGIKQTLIVNNTFPELSPQHEYIFNVIVSSTYIRVVLDVYDADNNLWQLTSGELDKEQIGSYPWSMPLGTWHITDTTNEWEEVDQETQIGDYPSNTNE